MKKAIIVGGGSGIGLAIAKDFSRKGYHTVLVDKNLPDSLAIEGYNNYEYIHTDLLSFDESLFKRLSADVDVKALMITAGFGRAAAFEHLSLVEINNLMAVNATAGIKIISCFYDRIRGTDDFYCGMMTSIAGLISSPLFSVYAASKAALCRFIESINIEIEVHGSKNRILNVAPASIKGTRFNGGTNDPDDVKELAAEIVRQLVEKKEQYIPQYEETLKDVIQRYQKDPHEYGLHSYAYKMQSGRVSNDKRITVGYLTGTFDLFHVGHLNILRRAKEQCDYLIVGVHESGAWKKKETFVPFEERMQIVESCKYVDRVVKSCAEDSDAWEQFHYDKLFVGSDYKGSERFARYEEYFKDKAVEIVYLPYTKETSSTQLRRAITRSNESQSAKQYKR